MATWRSGQPWRVVNGLQTLNTQLRLRYARAAAGTPASAWGSIGDTAHSSTSDHYPHYYAALGPTAVVCARDFPHAPALGLDFGAVAESLRLSRDSRIGYVIFNGRVFSGHAVGDVPAFVWRKYTGSDQHHDHGHVSTVHTAAADNGAPWQLPGDATTGDDDMALSEPVGWAKQFLPNPPGSETGPWLGGTLGNQLQHIRETTYSSYVLDRLNNTAIAALTKVIEQLADVITAGEGSVPVGQILAGVDERLTKLAEQVAAEQRDAVADLAEGGAAQVRADTDGNGD